MLGKVTLSGLLVAAGAMASVIFTPTTPDSLTLTVLSLNSDSSVLGYDLRGTEGGTVNGLGTIFLTDGTALGIPAPANPNIFLIVIDQALDQSGLLTFGTPVVEPPGLVQTATFAPFTVITDPALAAFVDSAPLTFDWRLTGVTPGATTTVSTWDLIDATGTATATPEPESFAMLGFGVMGIGLIRRYRCRNRLV
jgi:hypothetical protein